MQFIATKVRVSNRGTPPESFLTELVEWAKLAPDDLFEANSTKDDIFTRIRPELGPWMGLNHRRSAMCEAMRVHAGFESGWNWNEGVDTTNKTSMANPVGQETGIFQVSFDSTYIANNAMKPFAEKHDIATVDEFIAKMKSNHHLALDYYAHLVRINIRWAGPLLRNEINPWLSRASMVEFGHLLT